MTPLEHIMGLMDPSYAEPVRRSMAQSILDKHAHELAEQIRQMDTDPNTHWAADHIDPLKQGDDA
jgi:hypothetical protein